MTFIRGPWSLAAKLTAWYALTAFAIVLVATGLLYGALSRNLYQEDQEALASKIENLRMLARQHPEDRRAVVQEVVWEASSEEPVILVRLLRPDGRIELESPGMDRQLPVTLFEMPGANLAQTPMRPLGPIEGKSYLATSARDLAPHDGLRIQAALDRSREASLLSRYRHRLLAVLACALIACALFGYFIARSFTRPLKQISRRIAEIGSESLDVRLDTADLPSEVGVLAEAFNGMLSRLDASFARLGQFSSDLAHELRTPLNNLLGETEVALSKVRTPQEYQAVLVSGREEYERLSKLIDSMLFLARAEGRSLPIAPQRLELAHELEVLRAFYEAAASEAGVRLEVAVPDAIDISVERTLFQRAIGNLISNALSHTPPGGGVTLSGTYSGAHVEIAVQDTGCGIPPEHLPHVFERFYRVEAARTSLLGGSAGLGLALVKSIAGLHGGSVSLESVVSRGTQVVFRLPRVTKS